LPLAYDSPYANPGFVFCVTMRVSKSISNISNKLYVAAATVALIATTANGFVNPVPVTVIPSTATAGRKAGTKRSFPETYYSRALHNEDDFEQSASLPLQQPSFTVGGGIDSVILLESSPRSTTDAFVIPITAGRNLAVPSIEVDALRVETESQDNDLARQILLDSFTRTRPGDVLDEVETHRTSIGRDTNHSNATSFTDKNVIAAAANYNVDTPISLDDVKAVLALSEEAAILAEASMSPEIVDRLQLGPNAGTNATITTTNANEGSPMIGELDGVKEFISSSVPSTSLDQILPASRVAKEPVSQTTTIEAPDVGKILNFAIPAIGVWLCGPLLSLIDTSAVGVFSGTVQQAALNPAVAVTDYAALLIAFMYTGTTNMVAAAQESDRGTVDKPRTAKTMIGAMQMSTFVGAGLGSILFVFARHLLKAIIGNDAISPAVFAAAMRYVRIRALGMPAAAIIGSTQAACLGMQDIRSPLYVLVAAAVVNFFGDVILVGNSHPLIGGAAGAAWATVISQYVAVVFFVHWLCSKPDRRSRTPPQVLNVSDAILKMTGKPGENIATSCRQSLHDVMETLKITSRRRKIHERMEKFAAERKEKRLGRVVAKLFERKNKTSSPKCETFTVRGFLQNRFTPKDLLKVPNQETRQEFAPYVVPVTTTQVGRVSGYVAMSHVVASSLGTVSMAAQQVIVSLFYCLCPIADSLNLTAQSFIPVIAAKKASIEKATALRKAMRSFLKAGAVSGGVMMVAVTGIPFLSGLFTSDAAVINLVNSVVPLLLVFFGTHGFVCASEGLLLGQKDLGFIGKMYAFFFGALPFFMMRVKRAALSGSHPVNLRSVWNVFVGYQVFRCVVWLMRLRMLQRQSDRDAAASPIRNDNSIAP
jgi:Na+-driven multidrug efflux pump